MEIKIIKKVLLIQYSNKKITNLEFDIIYKWLDDTFEEI